jgi:glycosyltransferase involved in cell wall biosynthesis
MAAQIRGNRGLAGETVVVFAGRFTAQKSVVEIIESASAVQAARRNVIYLLAGYFENAEYARAVRATLKRLAIKQGGLRFLGKLSMHEIRDLYSIADMALVPSLYEGVPYSALEAMASGVPVIATDTCGISDLIEHRESGILVPLVRSSDDSVHETEACRSADIVTLTSSQFEIMDDHRLASRLAKNGRARVLQLFTIERMVNETIRVYEGA